MDDIPEPEVISEAKKLSVIEKELTKTTRHLNPFQPELANKIKLLGVNTINSERNVHDVDPSCSTAVSFSEDETKHYFELHLNQLVKERGSNKTWKPYEVKPSAVIKVITCLKPVEYSKSLLPDLNKEVNIPITDDMKQMQVTGQVIKKRSLVLSEPKESIDVPNNSSDATTKQIITKMNHFEVKDVTLEKFVNTLKNIQFKQGKKTVNTRNMSKIFSNIWYQRVKQYKTRIEFMRYVLNNQKIKTTCLKLESKINTSKKRTSEDRKQNRLHSPLELKPINTYKLINCCEPNSSVVRDEDSSKAIVTSCVLKKKIKSKIDSKVITPKNVSLSINHIPKTIANNKIEKTPLKPKKTMNQKPFSNRLAAQEKIIEKQKASIEKLKKENTTLKVNNFELKSRQKSIIYKYNCAPDFSNFGVKLKPSLKAAMSGLSKSAEVVNKYNAKVDKSEIINRSLKERQEHCKQLYEMTKMRKSRKEEEEVNKKIELEVKIKEQKKEQQKLHALKIVLEKQSAENNVRAVREKKVHISNLTKKAVNHHNYILMRNSLNQLKSLIEDATKISDQCKELYKRKVLRKVFTAWKQETTELIVEKSNFADSFYNNKLMRLSWTTWRRVSTANGKIMSKL